MRSDTTVAHPHPLSRIPIDTRWELVQLPRGLSAASPEQLASGQFTSGQFASAQLTTGQSTTGQGDTPALAWRGATVPGTVAATLRDAGQWSWESPVDIDAHEWWYRCHFSNETFQGSNDVSLVFDGLATIADVWLNDTHIVRSDNMFCAHTVAVGSLLRDTNTLYLRFASLTTELAKRRPRPAWRTRLVDQQQLRWIRTTLLGRMPGWSAGPHPVGPWRQIALEVHDGFEVLDRTIRTQVDGTIHIDIRVRGIVDRASCTVEAAATSREDNRPTVSALTCQVHAHETVISGTVSVDRAERWWPHTHGAQPRYRTTIACDINGTTHVIDCGHVAFRQITHDTTNGNFALQINGVPVFCRGACWSTADVVRLAPTDSTSRTHLEDALRLAREAGMNMLRVGGTMVYEDPLFYELCDELGILVWQDFMFANMDYPFTDETFARSVREEITQFIRRTQTNACITLWCGNSEIEQQTAMLGLPREQWSNTFFQETLPALCAELRPDVPYWPSSPSGGVLPFHVNAGDAHYFGYGPYLRSLDDVRTSGVRFASEALAFAHVPELETIDRIPGGASGAGHHPAWKAAVPRDNGSSWDFEDVRDHYVGQLFRVNVADLRYGDNERYLALGRVASGQVIENAISYWRRPDSGCHGALLWFYRDLRPGAGWGIVDSTGLPKAAYYAMRRTSCPTAVFLSDDGLNGVTVTIINDESEPLEGALTLSLYRMGEIDMGNATRSVTVAPHHAVEIQADTIFDGFRDLSYAYRFGPPNHDLIVATLRRGAGNAQISDAFLFPTGLPAHRDADLGLTASIQPLGDGRYVLDIRSRRFAQSVAVDVPHFRPDDNYFHVAPHSSKTVILHPLPSAVPAEGAPRRPVVQITPLNSALSVRITGP